MERGEQTKTKRRSGLGGLGEMGRGEKNARLQRGRREVKKETVLPKARREERLENDSLLPLPIDDEDYDAGDAPNLVPSACPSSDRWL